MDVCSDVGGVFHDEDFDFGVLLEDDFLTNDSGTSTSSRSISPNGEALSLIVVVYLALVTSSQPYFTGRALCSKVTVVKSARADSVGRMRKRIFRPREGQIDNNIALNSIQCRQYLRRKNASDGDKFKLYAFPSFDKCDSLLFLPTSLAALFNSGDMKNASRLLYSHVAKDCRVYLNILSSEEVTPRSLVKFQCLMTDAHPDSIMCVHNTKVVGNEIHASVFFKFTANKDLYRSTAKTKKDAVFRPIFSTEREESMKNCLRMEGLPEDELSQYYAKLDTDLDLVIYKKAEMVLAIDDVSKKVTYVSLVCRVTAIEVAVPVRDQVPQLQN